MTVRVIQGDCRDVLHKLPDASVQCCVTSPPYYGLRNYGVAGQIGLEASPAAYVDELVAVFAAVRRVLRDDGVCWLNLGDSYCTTPNGPALGSSGLQGGIAPHAQHRLAHARRSKGIPAGLKHKDLLMIPARVAIALQADGWWLRSDIIWHKPNPMPESVTDRPTSAHEHVFLLTKCDRYFFDADAIREAESVANWDDGSRTFGGINKHGANAQHGSRTTGRVAGPRKRGTPPRHAAYASSDQSGLDTVGRGQGRNSRNVWTIATRPYSGAHFAVMPPELAERCILAGSRPGDTILDPFSGAGTTALVADRLGRSAIGIELNPAYHDLAIDRVATDAPLFAAVAAG